jgi:hypothetical protein
MAVEASRNSTLQAPMAAAPTVNQLSQQKQHLLKNAMHLADIRLLLQGPCIKREQL